MMEAPEVTPEQEAAMQTQIDVLIEQGLATKNEDGTIDIDVARLSGFVRGPFYESRKMRRDAKYRPNMNKAGY